MPKARVPGFGRPPASTRRVAGALGLILAFMAVEVAAGVLGGGELLELELPLR